MITAAEAASGAAVRACGSIGVEGVAVDGARAWGARDPAGRATLPDNGWGSPG
jgi:hypothetical protein